MHDLPPALFALVATGEPHSRLHRRMILFLPCEAEEPVGQRQVAVHDDAEVPPFDLEGVREVRQALLPHTAEGLCTSGLERWFAIEEHDIGGVVGHDSVNIFGADGTCLIGDELSNLGFVVCGWFWLSSW
jgi:hypothetical protein